MRKLYALMVCALILGGFSSANAQSYTISSYLCRVFSGPYTDITGTSIAELAAGGQYNYYYVSNEITMPFNFRFVNTVTNKIKVMANGAVIVGGTAIWPDECRYEYSYSGWMLYYPTQLYPQYGYGYYPNNLIAPWATLQMGTSTSTYEYLARGVAPNREFVVETSNKSPYLPSPNAQGSFQVILKEAGISSFEMQYNRIATGNWQYYGQYTYYPVSTGIKSTGYSEMKSVAYHDNYADNTAPAMTSNGIYDNQYYSTPTKHLKWFIAYPYDMAIISNSNPADQAIRLNNVTITPQTVISNEGSSVPTSVTLRRQIWRLGDAAPIYNQTVVLPGAAGSIPASFTTTTVTFPTWTSPTGLYEYGIYRDSTFVVTTSPADQYLANDIGYSEFTISPPNNIKSIGLVLPAPGSRTSINQPIPVTMRFRNIGTQNQTAVPVTAVIRDPNGNVVYRDTSIIRNFLSGTTRDTTFRDWRPTINGTYRLYAIAILQSDEFRGDDTNHWTTPSFGLTPDFKAGEPVFVRFEIDLAARAVFAPQPDEEKPYTKVFRPIGQFESIGVSDQFDIPARVRILRCTDGQVVYQADSVIPELNIDQGIVKFGFPTEKGSFDVRKLTPGCYNICVIANHPLDGDRSNDTACSTFSVIDRLRGNIEVGVGRRFQTLSAAFDSMSFRGIGGNLNLILTDATYTENGNTSVSTLRGAIDAKGITGTSDTAIVTIKPKAGVSPTITFTGNKPFCFYFGYRSAGYFRFDGLNQANPQADQLVAEPAKRGMTIRNNSITAGSIFAIEYGNRFIQLRNMKLYGNGNYSNDSSSVIRIFNLLNDQSYLSGVRDTVRSNNIVIDNNEIGRARYGVFEYGLRPHVDIFKNVFFDLRDYNNSITRNTIGTQTNPIGSIGVVLDHVENSTVAHNEISWIDGSLSGAALVAGIHEGMTTAYPTEVLFPGVNGGPPVWQLGAGNLVNMSLDANKIHNISGTGTVRGIGVKQANTIYVVGNPGPNQARSVLPVNTKNKITNNMIYDLRTTVGTVAPVILTTASPRYMPDRDSVVNNTISVAKAYANVMIENSKHPFVWNNIIQNTGGNSEANYFFSVPRPMETAVSSDYNLFDLRSPVRFATINEYDVASGALIQTRYFRSLNDYRTAMGQDIHSVAGDPLFTSDSLHLPGALSYLSSPASNAGAWLNTASLRRDFDGDLRQQGNDAPDIGADEYEGFQYTNDLAVTVITKPAGFSRTSDISLVTTENPLLIQGIVKNLSAVAVFNKRVTATVEVSMSGGSYQQIYSASKTLSFDVNESKTVNFTGPTLTDAQVANGTFRVRMTVENDQNNANNMQEKLFTIMLKKQAVLLAFNSSTAKGVANKNAAADALRRLGVAFDSIDLVNYTQIDVDFTPWWTLVWSSGDPNSSISGNLSIGGLSLKNTEELTRFLQAGQTYAKKSLIMAGQNIARYNDVAPGINGNGVTDQEFTRNYLHMRYVKDYPQIVGTNYMDRIKGAQVYFQFTDSLFSGSPDVVAPAAVTLPVGDNVNGFAYYYVTHPNSVADSGAGTTWHGSTNNVVFYAFDWADPQMSPNVEAGINTSGTTRVMRGALDFISSFRGTILPVAFVDVKATAIASGNQITWNVAEQKNVARYEIETLGADWQKVGAVNAQSGNSYTFVDQNAVEAGKTYTYRVVSVDLDGTRQESATVKVSRGNMVADFVLEQNYPNPFNPSTKIGYVLPTEASVTIRVMDVTGNVVMTPVLDVATGAGKHDVTIDATGLSSGTYIYELTATLANGETVNMNRRMTLNK